MPCHRINFPGGGSLRMCDRGHRRRRCDFCNRLGAEWLCDGVGPGKKGTCDARICTRCATSRPDPDHARETIDFCPRCKRNAPPEQLELGAVHA